MTISFGLFFGKVIIDSDYAFSQRYISAIRVMYSPCSTIKAPAYYLQFQHVLFEYAVKNHMLQVDMHMSQ